MSAQPASRQPAATPVTGTIVCATTTKAYEVVFPNLAGVGDTSARAAFVIGKDGVIKYSEVTATPKDLPNFAAVKAALAK